MTRVDELSSEDHVNMSLVEFLEALARVADKVNFEQQIRAAHTLRRTRRRETMKLNPAAAARCSMKKSQVKEKNSSPVRRARHQRKQEQRKLAHKILILVQKMAISAMGKDYADKFLRIRSSEKDLKQLETDESSSEDEAPANLDSFTADEDSDVDSIYEANLIRP